MQRNDQDDRRIFNTLTIFALLIRCPAGASGGQCGCPFAELRDNRGLEEKFKLAESMTEERCLDLLGFHESCMSNLPPPAGESRDFVTGNAGEHCPPGPRPFDANP